MSCVPEHLPGCLPCYCMLITRSSRRPDLLPSFLHLRAGKETKPPLEVGGARAQRPGCLPELRPPKPVDKLVCVYYCCCCCCCCCRCDDDDCDVPTHPFRIVRKPVTSRISMFLVTTITHILRIVAHHCNLGERLPHLRNKRLSKQIGL
jgi:hypothetical protein